MQSLGSTRSPLEMGALVALVTLALAGVLGLIAVLDADSVPGAFGAGFGIAFAVFLSGATIVCALACLARRRAELVALTSIVVAGVALDLLVLAIWRDVENEGYAKVVGIGLSWSFFALIALGLTLAVDAGEKLSRLLYLGALISAGGAGLITTYLIATAGGDEVSPDEFSEGGDVYFSPIGIYIGDDELLRALGVAFVLLAAFWFGAIAAHRLERTGEQPVPG
ncbi:MAG TPA: hypothetical protein VJK66_04120 [Gaiellaceae bacterium]|nr:hypothetical protein [Gaiellaceae bacterium]